MRTLIILALLTACGGKGEKRTTKITVTGPKGETGAGCTVEPTDNGALITCGDSSVEILNGPAGVAGIGCYATEVEEGALITCEDSVVLIRHGEDAKKGKGK